MLLLILVAVFLVAMALMVFAMARVSARADHVAREQRAQIEGDLASGAERQRAAGLAP